MRFPYHLTSKPLNSGHNQRWILSKRRHLQETIAPCVAQLWREDPRINASVSACHVNSNEISSLNNYVKFDAELAVPTQIEAEPPPARRKGDANTWTNTFPTIWHVHNFHNLRKGVGLISSWRQLPHIGRNFRIVGNRRLRY